MTQQTSDLCYFQARKAYLDGIKAFQEASETYKGIAAEKVKARAKAEKTAQKKKKESQELGISDSLCVITKDRLPIL